MILEHNLVDTMNTLYPDGYVYQEDNAPCHKAIATKEWMQNNKIKVLKWPPGSPDLNPIENLWAIMKRDLEMRNPRNISELKAIVDDLWENVSMET
ncbi:Transposable element Tcb2 transposase-like protein, partial [Leptotrombidium deliense]